MRRAPRPGTRPGGASVPGWAALVAALLPGCWFRPAPPPPPILLVTLDGVSEADAAGLPALARVSGPGVTFADAESSSPLTQPALASLLTGLPPFAHGVRDDGDFALAPDQVTVAERLRDEAGYATVAARTSALTDERFGLHQGFDTVLGVGARDQVFPDEAPAATPVEAVVGLLPGLPDRTFVWVHLGGPAWPFEEPPAAERLADLDAGLVRLLDAWEMRFGARGLVVVTSDRGPPGGALGEQRPGLLLHDATLRVPLVARGAPELGLPGSVVRGPVGTVDVAGTLLRAAGLRISPLHPLVAEPWRPVYAESHAGRSLFGMVGLASLSDRNGRTVTGGWLEHCVAPEGPCTLDDPDPDRWLDLRGDLPDAVPVHASLDGPTLEALSGLGYVGGDPLADPAARDPRAEMEAVALYRRARTLLQAGFTREASEALVTLDQAWPDAFALRVLEGQLLWRLGRLRDAEAHWRSVFPRTPTATVALAAAEAAAAQGRWHEAHRWFAEARRLDPENRTALAGAFRATYESGDRDLADDLSAAWLAANDDRGALAPLRAEILADQQQLDAAREEAERGVAAAPGSAWARMARARVRWERGQVEEAVAEAREAVALDPYAVAPRIRLGRWLIELGTHTEAVRVLAPAARILSDDAAAQSLYDRARAALTEEEQFDRRIDRAQGPG